VGFLVKGWKKKRFGKRIKRDPSKLTNRLARATKGGGVHEEGGPQLGARPLQERWMGEPRTGLKRKSFC